MCLIYLISVKSFTVSHSLMIYALGGGGNVVSMSMDDILGKIFDDFEI